MPALFVWIGWRVLDLHGPQLDEVLFYVFFFSSRRRHTRCSRDWSSDVCSSDLIGSVFKEFTQADSTMTRRYGGTGLGLAISQRLVRLMGGELGVSSEVGRGSQFSFGLTLPVESSPPTRTTRLATLGGRRMLIVADNQTDRRLLRDVLAAEGLTV